MMLFSSRAKTYLRLLANLLGLAGVIFVGYRLFQYWHEIELGEIGAGGYAAIALLASLYAAANILLAAGWRAVLAHLGVQLSFRNSVRIYALSQLAKYVPGNVFHLVGRQAFGMASGIGNAPLAKSSALELSIIALCPALFLPLLFPVVWDGSGGWVGLALFVAATATSVFVVARYVSRDLAKSVGFYATFLAVSGAIFAAAFFLAGGETEPQKITTLVAAYVIGWLAGLLTPGAPAGLGVREAVLLFLLGSLGSQATILLAVVISRAITVLGDLAFYATGHLIGAPATSERKS